MKREEHNGDEQDFQHKKSLATDEIPVVTHYSPAEGSWWKKWPAPDFPFKKTSVAFPPMGNGTSQSNLIWPNGDEIQFHAVKFSDGTEWDSVNGFRGLLKSIEIPYNQSLTFDALRAANMDRLPLFKNALGEPAHTEPDGSDWSPADWMTATLGELGEAANIMKKIKRGDYEEGGIPFDDLAREFADVVTYLDILAMQFGIDLGEAVRTKFNEVSVRVGSAVRL